MAVALLVATVASCAPEPRSLSFRRADCAAPAASEDATAQAEATLRRFLEAWASKDETTGRALLVDPGRVRDWESSKADREIFGPIRLGSVSDYARDAQLPTSHIVDPARWPNMRAFEATHTVYYKQGQQGLGQHGVTENWFWVLERNKDGDWRILAMGRP